MKVSVRLFAGLRERAGAQHVEIELPDGAVVEDLLTAMGQTPVGELHPGECVVAINREYAGAREPVNAGDEVVLFGPGRDGEPTAQDWADVLGTISYEIVTRIGVRVPRTYAGVGA